MFYRDFLLIPHFTKRLILIIKFATLDTVFSLNFSSAGKGPFMDGKAKNIYFSKRGGGGGGDGGVRDMDPPSLGNFLFPYFKTYFTQICCRYL